MVTRGTPSQKYPYKTSKKDLAKSYELRLAAQFGNRKSKEKLWAYNRRRKERRMEANKIEWEVNGLKFNRYKMMSFIVARTANGERLSDICDDPEMPSVMQVYKWFENHPDFEKEFRMAEQVRGHLLGDEVERIARGTDRENVSADKLKTEVLSKAAARLNPRFQDKVQTQVVDEYGSMTPDQIRDRISRMIQANPELATAIPVGTLSSQESPEPVDAQVLPNEGLDEIGIHDEAGTEPSEEDHPLE